MDHTSIRAGVGIASVTIIICVVLGLMIAAILEAATQGNRAALIVVRVAAVTGSLALALGALWGLTGWVS